MNLINYLILIISIVLTPVYSLGFAVFLFLFLVYYVVSSKLQLSLSAITMEGELNDLSIIYILFWLIFIIFICFIFFRFFVYFVSTFSTHFSMYLSYLSFFCVVFYNFLFLNISSLYFKSVGIISLLLFATYLFLDSGTTILPTIISLFPLFFSLGFGYIFSMVLSGFISLLVFIYLLEAFFYFVKSSFDTTLDSGLYCRSYSLYSKKKKIIKKVTSEENESEDDSSKDNIVTIKTLEEYKNIIGIDSTNATSKLGFLLDARLDMQEKYITFGRVVKNWIFTDYGSGVNVSVILNSTNHIRISFNGEPDLLSKVLISLKNLESFIDSLNSFYLIRISKSSRGSIIFSLQYKY